MRIRFYANAGKSEAAAKRAALAARLGALGLEEAREGGAADAIVALGGDGTILRAVREFPDVPVLGLNLGGLGYLSSVGEADAEAALGMLAAGRYSISGRALIEVRSAATGARAAATALNDVVLTRERTGHMVSLDLAADGRFVTRYMADGLIFATPTGSTAYSLAAGGPVLLQDSGSVVVTPLNPHALGVRPLVFRDGVRFTVCARARTDGNPVRVGVYADGEHVMSFDAGESVAIARSEKTAKFVELEGYDPYDVLARKLGWSGSGVRWRRDSGDGPA